MATPLTLNTDNSLDPVSGSVNAARQEDSSIKKTDNTDWYSVVILTTGTYTFNMDMTSGTATDYNRNISVIIYDENKVQIHAFDTGSMDAAGDHMSQPFDISDSGFYYIQIYRNEIRAAQYNFSMNLSI